MYDFHYNIARPFFGENNINLLYLDTDSFIYRIFTNDLYEGFNNPQLSKYLDLSDYP